ncbi:M56 family metallopeptidase [Lentiprolixibacter aurantiacus]|uniref:M56 family peptidase n=1 Tax=Lentiprolixibacter aurantiacus TaxID=2993939 RepID=A0AAE3MMG6_9FLAO|nr:M56 family metallopeptidase [Lentiprolixibacter aurantiacus]MCX2720550.1 M56 family peptidase [Lentiprolixibacter aurantiacus]
MEAVFIYFLKASGILAIFWGVYHLFLKKETFFEANRHFLLAGILAAFTFPFLKITRYVTVESSALPDFSGVPVIQNSEVASASIPWEMVMLGIYGLGVLFLLVKFLFQLLSLRKLMLKHRIKRCGAFKLVETDQDLAPFSFFNYIFYNPRQFSKDELEAIRQHEEAHCAQKHSIDVLLAHLLTIALWMNPLSWLYRKNIQQNLEFLADFSAVNRTRSKKSYQYALLKVSSNPIQTPITNNFYNSLIKKRIVMLHKSRSNQLSAYKFALVIPMLAAFVFAFNTKVVAQKEEVIIVQEVQKIKLLIDKDYTQDQMDKDIAFMKERNITLKFKGVKRNSAGEITAITATYKTDKGQSGSYSLNGDEPIAPFAFQIDGDADNQTLGFYAHSGKHKAHSIGSNMTKKIIVEVDDDDLHEGKHKKHKVVRLNSGDKDVHTWVHSGDGEAKEIRVEIKDGKKVVFVDGKEVSEDELGLIKGKGQKIKIKKLKKGEGENVFIIKDSDEDHDIEVIEKEGNGFFFVDSGKGEEPLFIVDGKEMDRAEFKSNLSPNQIEKVEVLKGDKATEKYGDKARDGVIVITTKKGN